MANVVILVAITITCIILALHCERKRRKLGSDDYVHDVLEGRWPKQRRRYYLPPMQRYLNWRNARTASAIVALLLIVATFAL